MGGVTLIFWDWLQKALETNSVLICCSGSSTRQMQAATRPFFKLGAPLGLSYKQNLTALRWRRGWFKASLGSIMGTRRMCATRDPAITLPQAPPGATVISLYFHKHASLWERGIMESPRLTRPAVCFRGNALLAGNRNAGDFYLPRGRCDLPHVPDFVFWSGLTRPCAQPTSKQAPMPSIGFI